MLVIKNGKDSQTLSFGYSCLKALGELWDCKGIQETIQKVFSGISIFVDFQADGTVVEKNDVEDIPFEIIDLFVDILKSATKEESFNGKDYGDWVFENLDQMGKVMIEFMKSLPQEKKQIAPKPKK